MTTVNNSKKFFVFGLLNGAGETFSGKKEYASIIDGGKKGQAFYEGLGFTNTAMTTCHGVALIKDSNDRVLSFVAPVSHMSKKTCSIKEYNMTYWAWSEVKRQAQVIVEKAAAAKKASAKVDAEVEEGREVATDKKESTTIKGSIEVRGPQQKMPWYYAVKNGRTVGIFTDWAEASASVTGYPDARFKKFRALKDAQEFMNGGDNE